MDFETMWYEASPYIYAIVGVASFFNRSFLAFLSGAILIAAALTILHLRRARRKAPPAKVKKLRKAGLKN